MKIFINPGHCVDVDPGACGNGLVEAEVALNIGRLLEKYLQAVGFTTKVFQYDGLRAIADDANNWGADLFISIHCNAANNAGAHGTETFCWNAGAGKSLATAINKQIVKSLNLFSRGVKQANFAVLAYTNMPAVLVETAFITHKGNAQILATRQDDFARAIARGITDFLQEGQPLPDVIDLPVEPGKLSPHFDASEFTCHHCGAGADKISKRLIDLLEQLRENIGGLPLHVNSGYRCPYHNSQVGGVPNSQHVLGTAADIATPAGMSFENFKWYVQQLPFDGVGFYAPDFIHVDTRNGGTGSKIFWEG